ncbi:MAG TPA: class I SAM-dependent methyltransferase [Puia sp.]|nr:class I SAM-dependent methyltransferase [Puia sp.]
MYSRSRLARKYLHYYLTASNGRGHGIHSPFVYELVRRVLNDAENYPAYSRIAALRRQLEKNPAMLEIEDLGAGSSMNATRQRSVADLAKHAAKSRRLGQLLFRIAHYYKPRTILELGTSLGLSAAYLASGAEGAKVFSIEGSAAVAAEAGKNFRTLGLGNIEQIVGDFDLTLAGALNRIGGTLDLAFIDGNHRLEPTLRYFNSLLGHLSSSSVLVFDDIHWSEEMEQAWEKIKEHPRTMMTVDLFFVGLVFFREEFKTKQHFTIRF